MCLVSINEWTHGPVALITVTLILFCNSFEKLRLEMACSGHNAPLTDEGFRLVAALRSTEQMAIFLMRTIEGKTGCDITDKEKLKLVASRCFRDGVPLDNFEELVHRMQHLAHKPKWMKGGKTFTPGALVLVYERYCATITQGASQSSSTIYVDYDEGRERPEGITRLKNVPVDLSTDRVIFRKDVGFANNIPMNVSQGLEVQSRKAKAYIDILQTKVLPSVQAIGEVFSWKKPWVTRSIAWGCFFASIVLFMFSEWYKLCGDTGEKPSQIQKWLRKTFTFIKCGEHKSWVLYEETAFVFHRTVALFLDHGFMMFFLIAGIFLMLTEAAWLSPVKAVITILGRSCVGSCCPRKKAPK
eukprot:CAMPEP_0169191804 /NCGR_PEP_ID=MMETSP1016-20121227/5268_1 /TAXON_ID=342587 /ORGANISM="Karlodinium micrum, Strain CCMP2283" /LENGTH=356 /DNA_ID=CAMNT_0009268085 /DNA_START=88 /DNA_END=1155 /DNA_ORIENTATION=+